MSDPALPSADQIRQMAAEWYSKLDVHAPMVELLPLLAGNDLEMQLPEGTIRGSAGFERWYQGVIRIFFDEVHSLKQVDVVEGPGGANVTVVVNWQASRWLPPAAKSERINCDAYQRWVVIRSPETGKPVILTYIVDRLEYLAGSVRL